MGLWVLKQLFSQENIYSYLNAGSFVSGEPEPYTSDELDKIHKAVDDLFNQLTQGVKPSSSKPKFILATGAPGSGKTTYLEDFTKNSEEQFACIDIDIVRNKMELFKEALSQKFNEGASLAEADDYAYHKYRNASMFITRSIINRLVQNNYNIAFPFQPISFNSNCDSLMKAALENGYDVTAKVLHAPFDQLETAVQNRADLTGRQIQAGYLEAQYRAIEQSIINSLNRTEVETELYWRPHHDSAPVLAAKTNGSRVELADQKAFIDLKYELQLSLLLLRNTRKDAFDKDQTLDPTTPSHSQI